MGRTQHAPRMETIIVALVVTLIGVVGTFGHALPTIAGASSETLGIIAYVAATVILLLGVFFRRI
jgi:hypothetical protein